jgi:hypothetical protein
MKTFKKLIAISVLIFTISSLSAQVAPPPNNGGGENSQTPQEGGNAPVGGGGAPIGSGLFILLGLGAAYGGKKIYNFRSEQKSVRSEHKSALSEHLFASRPTRK